MESAGFTPCCLTVLCVRESSKAIAPQLSLSNVQLVDFANKVPFFWTLQ